MQDLFAGALVVGSVSDAVATGFRGPVRLTPAVSALKWAYQPMTVVQPDAPGPEGVDEVGFVAVHDWLQLYTLVCSRAARLTPRVLHHPCRMRHYQAAGRWQVSQHDGRHTVNDLNQMKYTYPG